ncbi:MAG: sensor histidine kinase [Pseudomonadota bacterium]|nr:sensor histidine kinase [Pseudomonadota bacterium]
MLHRHSLLWRLALLLVCTAVTTMVLGVWLMERLRDEAQYLDDEAVQVLQDYAGEAEQAWLSGGESGVAEWLTSMRHREQGDIAVVDAQDQSLSGIALTASERAGLRFQRGLGSRMSFRYGNRMPHVGIPFPVRPDQGRLLMQLPPRYRPGTYWPWVERLLLVGIPTLSALGLGALLFWRVRVPLLALQRQVLRFKDDPQARVSSPLSQRHDEFGDVARSFNHMAEQVAAMLATQRQLLNDLSHELRTPLSRLAVALESPLGDAALRCRVAQELERMRTLVNDTLTLGWQDTADNETGAEPVSLIALWDMVTENAAFESGWAPCRFPCDLPESAHVQGNLNDLAQLMENLVRNAVRHSPAGGLVSLDGQREAGYWHLWVSDQGPGVPEDKLDAIFSPFVRLDSARAGAEGFGLGLSIARRSVQRLGGQLWAENARPGLRVHLRLSAV